MSAKSTNSVICATAYRTRAGTGILKTCYQDGSFDLEGIEGLVNGDSTHRAVAGVNVHVARCARCGGPVGNGAQPCCESCKEAVLMGEPEPELPGHDLSVRGHDLSDNRVNPNAGMAQAFPKGRWS